MVRFSINFFPIRDFLINQKKKFKQMFLDIMRKKRIVLLCLNSDPGYADNAAKSKPK